MSGRTPVSSSVAVLNGLLAREFGDPEGREVTVLPRLEVGVVIDVPVGELGGARTKRAVTVEDEQPGHAAKRRPPVTRHSLPRRRQFE
jgi:hypothetical protein